MKKLKFIHITKTGGSSIEECAFKKHIYYGIYDNEYNKNNINNGIKTDFGEISRWHVLFPLNNIEYKQKYDWFMVVRNPYTRIISEINYLINLNIINVMIDLIKDLDYMNNLIQQCIIKRSEAGDHFTEQYLYLDPDPSIKIHVLKFENMKEEFDNLMKLYNIDLVLDVHNNKSKSVININDLSKDTIKLINTVYDMDFVKFNYEKINTD